MKLVCTIGSQGFADGRRFYRGDVYEVDDELASTAVEAGYAQVVETDVPTPPVEEPEVKDKDSVPRPAKKKNVNTKKKNVNKRR